MDTTLGIQKDNEQLAPRTATPTIARVQPRAGFSFPVSVSTVFHVNYGTFLQRPPFQYLVAQQLSRNDLLNNGTALSVYGILGNPRLKPEVTNSYDIGVAQGLGEGFTLDISGYYKDVKDLLQRAVYSTSQAAYTTYVNLDYADIRGFRIGFAKRSGIFTGTINYTYGVATGKNASPDGNQYPTIHESGTTTYQTPVPLDVFLDFDRTHNLVANLGMNTPQGWGPSLYGVYPFEEFTVAVTSFARSGRPFSSAIDRSSPMNRRTPAEYTTNLKITRRFNHFFGASASFYLEISNLFNNRIYNYTAVFNPDQTNTANLQKWTIKYENGEDIRYYEDDLRPGFLINQEFRLYSNATRSIQFGMIINL
jgi:outer membrane receptor protein involved in Fe transport